MNKLTPKISKENSSEKLRQRTFLEFNFTFNINYLFYLFKRRILIILNSPRVFPFSLDCDVGKIFRFLHFPSAKSQRGILYF